MSSNFACISYLTVLSGFLALYRLPYVQGLPCVLWASLGGPRPHLPFHPPAPPPNPPRPPPHPTCPAVGARTASAAAAAARQCQPLALAVALLERGMASWPPAS